MIEYGVPKYRISQAAEASGISLNTLRSYYQRGDFMIVGGDEKKGRGAAAMLTLEDVMCIALAARLIDVGVGAKDAFEAAVRFAYSGNSDRLPSQMSRSASFTIFVYWPTGESKIVATNDVLTFDDIFGPVGPFGRYPPVLILANDVERRVFWALRVGEPDFTL